ncbi:hypothetical protein [Nocardia terpenica]|uniref:hypothetical protein n=1 Tax=Nocardia terpenica TaxID=455432 RepID=UPI0012E8F978|nr:hypothetical protein [Nocardia terpenica]NQE88088.1 hypothetical protein [Nocardia terpenica]
MKRAAASVVIQWPDVIEADDLEQELWIWITESPSVRAKLVNGTMRDRHNLLVRKGHSVASATRKSNLRFAAEFHYSVDDAKAILGGDERGADSLDDLTEAMDQLRGRNPEQAEVIRRKYGEGEVLGTDAARKMLQRALVSLTDEMNRIVREKFDAYGGGPGSRKAISNQAAQAAIRV